MIRVQTDLIKYGGNSMRCFVFLLLSAVVLAGVASAGIDCKSGLSDMKMLNEKWSTGKYYDTYSDKYQDTSCQACQDKQYQDNKYQDNQYQDKQYQENQYQDKQYQDKQYTDDQYQDKQYQDKQKEDKTPKCVLRVRSKCGEEATSMIL
jgi:hypothetical protein